MKPFDYYVKEIESAMAAALVAASGGAGGYAPKSRPYEGELDDEEIGKESRPALSKLLSALPIFFATYAGGADVPASNHPWLFGEPREMVHHCTFTALCCAPDARGEREGQTESTQGVGVYRMIAVAQSALLGRQFEVVEGQETVVLNDDPFAPITRGDNVRFVVRRNNLTVFAVHFITSFTHWTTDWRTAGVNIEQFNLKVESRNSHGAAGGLPGVQFNNTSDGEG
ncbi:MAG TPA: phage protein Gp37 [Pyrinomonadaceae bacterium]|nr:phage protein Gp37 [Pyrinomonadaceae bacterium]